MNFINNLLKIKNDFLKKYRRFVGFVIVPILLLTLVALTAFIVVELVRKMIQRLMRKNLRSMCRNRRIESSV